MKLICFVGTATPIIRAHDVVVDALRPKTALAGDNGWTGTLEHDGRSQDVNVVQLGCTEDATALHPDWVIVAEQTTEKLIKTPIGRTIATDEKPNTIKVFVDQKGKCAPDAVERATKLLISCICGTHPLGQRPPRSDPHRDRYRRYWTPARD